MMILKIQKEASALMIKVLRNEDHRAKGEKMNDWLNNTETITEPEITFAQLKAEYAKGFQAGIDFAIEQMNRDVDLDEGITRLCACRKEYFGTDEQAVEAGWKLSVGLDTCPECAEMEKITDAPYFPAKLYKERKVESLAGVRF